MPDKRNKEYIEHTEEKKGAVQRRLEEREEVQERETKAEKERKKRKKEGKRG